MTPRYLSKSALEAFLESPAKYYWRYIQRLEPVQPSMATYDHDRLCGILWAEFVHRFYQGVPHDQNTEQLLTAWVEQTAGWLRETVQSKYAEALATWAATYATRFRPDDGVRQQSELELIRDPFIGYLDGLSADGVIHEVKTAGRSPQLVEQLWAVQTSLQIQLYSCLADATGVRIEFAFKDPPYEIYRADVHPIRAEDRARWWQGLTALARQIYALGDDPAQFPCHPGGCCLITRRSVSMCPYQVLCQRGLTEETAAFYRTRASRS